jgi:hypothetical protein
MDDAYSRKTERNLLCRLIGLAQHGGRRLLFSSRPPPISCRIERPPGARTVLSHLSRLLRNRRPADYATLRLRSTTPPAIWVASPEPSLPNRFTPALLPSLRRLVSILRARDCRTHSTPVGLVGRVTNRCVPDVQRRQAESWRFVGDSVTCHKGTVRRRCRGSIGIFSSSSSSEIGNRYRSVQRLRSKSDRWQR